MKTFIEEYRRLQNVSLASECEHQVRKNASLLETNAVLKEALEKIASLTTGESSRIACEALDSIYPIKGAAK